jgi:hypothetical protein
MQRYIYDYIEEIYIICLNIYKMQLSAMGRLLDVSMGAWVRIPEAQKRFCFTRKCVQVCGFSVVPQYITSIQVKPHETHCMAF